MVKSNRNGNLCDKERKEKQGGLGSPLPYLQNLQSSSEVAANLLYSLLPGEGNQGRIVPTPHPCPGHYGGFGFVQRILGFLYGENAEAGCGMQD